MLITNAFSLNMLAGDSVTANIQVTEVTLEKTIELAQKCRSVVGHADTAAVFSSVLGTEVPTNRETVTLKSGDEILVGQYIGPRLPEGATMLPEGARIKWFHLVIS